MMIRHMAQKDHVVIITKSIVESELLQFKSDFPQKGVDFKRDKLQRNNKGEIAQIKVTPNDNKCNKASVTDQGKNLGAIKKILVACWSIKKREVHSNVVSL